MSRQVTSSLERLTRTAQASARIPALSVALRRADRSMWTFQVGTTGRAGLPLDATTLFRMGSVTKSFTAVLVMQCRDDGLIDLDDPIGAHLDLPSLRELTIGQLLSHTSGMQREPVGDVWDTLAMPGSAELLTGLERAERVLTAGRRFHYSNLGFALLGHLVAKVRGGTWAELLADRVLRPLGLTSVCLDPGERSAVGYLVDAYSDHARPEPPIDLAGVAPAAQLWATAEDLAAWAAFLADPSIVDPDGAVLAGSTVEQMWWPRTTTDEAQWSAGFGLGVILVPMGGRVLHVGHDGAMPGFLAAAYGRRGEANSPRGFGAAVLGSSGTALATNELVHTLLTTSETEDPVDVRPWRPGEPAPAAYRSVLGRWWSEGFEYVFTWRDGELRASGADDPRGKPPAIFAPIDDEPDCLRVISGREVGERLRLRRDPASGTVIGMHWATYRMTRSQETFDGVPAGEP